MRSLYISNQGFFSGSILPAASVAHPLLVCSVAHNLSSYLCLGSPAGKEAGVKLFSSRRAELASLRRWLGFIRASDTAAISHLSCSFFASLLMCRLFLLYLQSQLEICILLPSGFPRCFRDELQATTIKARFFCRQARRAAFPLGNVHVSSAQHACPLG